MQNKMGYGMKTQPRGTSPARPSLVAVAGDRLRILAARATDAQLKALYAQVDAEAGKQAEYPGGTMFKVRMLCDRREVSPLEGMDHPNLPAFINAISAKLEKIMGTEGKTA